MIMRYYCAITHGSDSRRSTEGVLLIATHMWNWHCTCRETRHPGLCSSIHTVDFKASIYLFGFFCHVYYCTKYCLTYQTVILSNSKGDSCLWFPFLYVVNEKQESEMIYRPRRRSTLCTYSGMTGTWKSWVGMCDGTLGSTAVQSE